MLKEVIYQTATCKIHMNNQLAPTERDINFKDRNQLIQISLKLQLIIKDVKILI